MSKPAPWPIGPRANAQDPAYNKGVHEVQTLRSMTPAHRFADAVPVFPARGFGEKREL